VAIAGDVETPNVPPKKAIVYKLSMALMLSDLGRDKEGTT
jgi:hypothetical protein